MKSRPAIDRMRWRVWPGVAMAAALCLAPGGGSAGPSLVQEFKLTREQLLRNFDTIVFHNEFDNRIDARLRRWVTPVRVYLDIRAGDRDMILNIMTRHLGQLAEITGHDIALTADSAQANVVVALERDARLGDVGRDYFHDGFDIREVMQTNICFGRYHSNPKFEIYRAVIVVPTDRVMSRGRLAACLIEETTQILGLPNDSDSVFPSIFNDHSIDVDLTRQDMLLVKLLYDPRLRPGMERRDVLHNVDAILGELAPDGLTFPGAAH